MASNTEIRADQKDRLFDLLKMKKDNPGIVIVGLEENILKAMAVMEKEDVAWVEKMIALLP